ncbi:MAG TPA: hypothetical protein VIM52_07930, partial [Stellaceae bacterium]
IPTAVAEIEALGLATSASAVRAGLIACTGNVGCKFSLSDTKRHALEIADHLDARIDLDQPLNIHLTGCPNSCAQHYVGDIGLVATKVDIGGPGDDAEAEGYHVVVGGGSGATLALGREICRGIPADELPRRLETVLGAYLAQRQASESFQAFANRHSVEELAALFGAEPVRKKSLSALQGGEGGDPSHSDGQGEVGVGKRSGIPHLTPTLSAPGGGEGVSGNAR